MATAFAKLHGHECAIGMASQEALSYADVGECFATTNLTIYSPDCRAIPLATE